MKPCASTDILLLLSCASTENSFNNLIQKKSKIKLKDIAERAGVSVGTVDRVIHGRGEVNKTTRDNVLRIIEELGYRPNLLARSLALKKTYQITALLPLGKSAANPYWELPRAGIVKAANELHDYNIEVSLEYFSADDKKSFIKQSGQILLDKPDGIIFSPVFNDAALSFSNDCNKEGIPFILIDSNLEEANAIAYFGQNTIKSGYLSAKLMTYGLKDDATILTVNLTNSQSVTSHLRMRKKGFLDYINENKKAIKVIGVDIDMGEHNEPEKSLGKVFVENPQIEGVFVTNSRVHKVAEYLCTHENSNKLLLGYDLVEKNIEFLKKGEIDFLISQKPEEQGYKSVMALSNFVLTKQAIPRVNYSQIDIITKENIEFYNNI